MAKPYFKHFIRRLNPWNLLWPHKGKTLKSQLLKKLLIEFYETQDLCSPKNGKPKLFFYDYSWYFFSSPANRRGELCGTHCSCALYWFHDLWITIMLSLFFMFDAVGNVLQCSEYVPYRFLGWSNIIFWKFSLPMYNCFGISIFRLRRKALENSPFLTFH